MIDSIVVYLFLLLQSGLYGNATRSEIGKHGVPLPQVDSG